MVIGTWAELLYTDYFEQTADVGEVRVDMGKTHDIDVYFRNCTRLEQEVSKNLQMRR